MAPPLLDVLWCNTSFQQQRGGRVTQAVDGIGRTLAALMIRVNSR
jgi:hypothetical protein